VENLGQFPVDREALVAELEEAEMVVQLYRSLVKSRGWEELAKLLRAQGDNRLGAVMGGLAMQAELATPPRDGLTQILHTEFEKGVRSGLLMAADLPRSMIEFLEEQIKESRKAQEKGEAEEEDNE
jgi:hypothetical protein